MYSPELHVFSIRDIVVNILSYVEKGKDILSLFAASKNFQWLSNQPIELYNRPPIRGLSKKVNGCDLDGNSISWIERRDDSYFSGLLVLRDDKASFILDIYYLKNKTIGSLKYGADWFFSPTDCMYGKERACSCSVCNQISKLPKCPIIPIKGKGLIRKKDTLAHHIAFDTTGLESF